MARTRPTSTQQADDITRIVATLPPVLTLIETADVLRMSRRHVSRQIQSGVLRAHKLTPGQRGQVRVTSEAIGDYLRATRA
jgi:excisionase family DNA binding protein